MFRRVLMITCVVFLGGHLRSARIIVLLGSVRGRFDGLGDAL